MGILEALVSFITLVELILVLIGLERHQYIGGSYQHSIQHFAYLTIYFIGFVLLAIGGAFYERGMLFISIGTLILMYHIYLERKGYFN